MEILQFLISFFLKEYSLENLLPLFNCLKENSFDLKKTVGNLNLETVLPVVTAFVERGQKETPRHSDGGFGVKPIENFADLTVVRILNEYFA